VDPDALRNQAAATTSRLDVVFRSLAFCRLSLHGRRTGDLLHDMREFMRKQSPTRSRQGRELPRPEDDVVPHRVSVRIHIARRLLGLCIPGMDAHLREVMAETWLHEGASRRIERLTR
jgi:hypothetical protein